MDVVLDSHEERGRERSPSSADVICAESLGGTSGFWLSGLVSKSGVVCVGVSSRWAGPHLFQHPVGGGRIPRIPVFEYRENCAPRLRCE